MTERSRGLQKRIKRAIIYARVSKDDSKSGRSPKEQVDSCQGDCAYEGWTVAETLIDNDRGATRYSKRERENYARLPDILRRGDVLVVWEPSRITREPGEFATFCDMVVERGVLLYYDERLWDMDDDDDRARVWEDILDGMKSAGKTRKRVLRAMKANVSDMKPHGKTPPGYRIVRDKDGRSIDRVIVPAQQKILQTAADRVIEEGAQVSMAALSREFKADWVKAGGGGAFESRDITRALTSPTTFGMRVHGDEIAGKGTWEPVLDPELMPKLAKVLKDPGRLTHKGSDPAWLLSYIARCGVCADQKLPGVIDHKDLTKGGKRYSTYRCRKFSHVARNQELVDEYVTELLMQLLEDPEASAVLFAPEAQDVVSVDEEMATIERLRAEIKAYVREAAKTRMSATAVSVYVESLEEEIATAEARMRKPVGDTVLEGLIGPGIREEWVSERMPLGRQRAVIKRCLEVTIQPATRGRFSNRDLRVEVKPRRAA